MAHFVEQYIHAIRLCEDYDMLTSEVTTCIRKNVINHVSTDIKEAIDRLNVDTPYYKFVRAMVWAASVSDHTESSLNLLRYFCNKVASQYDNLSMEVDEFSLMVIAICADKKDFIKLITPDRKLELAKRLCNNYLCLTFADKEDDTLKDDIISSIEYIIDGKTMEDLDRIFKTRYSYIGIDEAHTGSSHRDNEVLRPLQALLINLIHNSDQKELLYQLCVDEWQEKVQEDVTKCVLNYRKKFNDHENESYFVLLHGFISNCVWYNYELSKTSYTNFVNPYSGKFIIATLLLLRDCYSLGHLDANMTAILIRDGNRILHQNYFLNEYARGFIDSIVEKYCYSGKYEDVLLEGDCLSAIKMHLNTDPEFDIWCTLEDKNKMALHDRVYATYVHAYVNPIITDAEKLLENKELTFEENADSESALEAAVKKFTDDQNDEDDYSDDEYDGPDIEATQSKKGYKKLSKTQADADRKIYKAFKKYKTNEEKVDSQLSKMLSSAKRAFTHDKTEQIIEGKRFTPIGLVKKILNTAAVFSFSKFAGFGYLLVSHTIDKRRTQKQKAQILAQIEQEIKLLDEKIDDARSDGNRKAKYALIRTRGELVRARDKIRYNLSATKKDLKVAKDYVRGNKHDSEI